MGIWDLETKIGFLNDVITVLNKAQTDYQFYVIQASVPGGMISSPSYIVKWLEDRNSISKSDRKAISTTHRTIANQFFNRAKRVRKDLAIDYLVGITPGMVAGKDKNDQIYLNHISTSYNRMILCSSYKMPEYAKLAGRPLEAVITGVAIAQLLVESNRKLEFHEDRGCIFDFHKERDTVVESLKTPMIEKVCLNLIKPCYRKAVKNMITVLTNYKRE